MTDLTLRQQKIATKDLRITCVVPAHNEEAVIGNFIPLLCQTLAEMTNDYEVIVVDDGSRDNTLAILTLIRAEFPIKVLSFSRNFGKEIAITAGLEHSTGDVVIIIDGDFQHPLTSLPELCQRWAEGYDMVYGVRQNRENESLLKRLFTQLFYKLLKEMAKTPIPANAGDFRLLDQRVVEALNECQERSRFMKGLYNWVGFKNIGVPYIAADRRAGGGSRFNFSRLTELAITGITSFSSIPLRIWSIIGFFISILALAYAIGVVISTLLYGVDTPGYATIVVAIMFLGGIQLLSIGVLGEYIGRIFDEVKKRPKYIVAKKIGFEDHER